MKNLIEMMFKKQEDSTKMKVWSIILLVGFALFSIVIYSSKISFNNLMVYLTALVLYLLFSLSFIGSLRGRANVLDMKKRLDKHL